MTNSPGFLRAPEGNDLAERFIPLLQENLLRVHSFAAGAELADALRDFRRRPTEQWLIERHGFRTPSQARGDVPEGSKRLDAAPPCRKVG
jgi:putative transposase